MPDLVVSAVPSLTETVLDMGLGPRLVGRTKFCVHPKEWVKNILRMGGTKNLDLNKIQESGACLLLANKEENTRSDIRHLSEKMEILLTEIATTQQALGALKVLGQRLGLDYLPWQRKMQDALDALHSESRGLSVAYLIWQNPWMSVGHDTYIHSLLAHSGFQNVMEGHTRYPEISLEQMQQADVVFLSSEPFPFGQKHIEELAGQLGHRRIFLVDGEAWSWYGTRLIHTLSAQLEFLERFKTF